MPIRVEKARQVRNLEHGSDRSSEPKRSHATRERTPLSAQIEHHPRGTVLSVRYSACPLLCTDLCVSFSLYDLRPELFWV